MINNPTYRQNWILDKLKINPTESYNDMYAKYSQEFAISRKTFDKDWKKAKKTFFEYQTLINNAKLEESIAQEKESVKLAILSKNQILEKLSKIAESAVYYSKDGSLNEDYSNKISAMKTINEMQGYKAPLKSETEVNINEIIFKVIES
jgi:hypothetical protein